MGQLCTAQVPTIQTSQKTAVQRTVEIEDQLLSADDDACPMRVAKQKELEGVVDPMMANVYRAAGGGGDVSVGRPGGDFDDILQVLMVTCMMLW